MKVPMRYILAAAWQWTWLAIVIGAGVLLTFFPMGPLVIATARFIRSPEGPALASHEPKYIAQGSSGLWAYKATTWPLLRLWNNLEDGLLGEPSGKHSAREKGNERSVGAQYRWLIRNPFNQAKRTSRLLACYVNDCVIDWWGNYEVTDKAPIVEGWHFCRATDKATGRVYYGFRRVRANPDGTVNNLVLGFKIRPEHAKQVQDADDLDKAFTLRWQRASQPD